MKDRRINEDIQKFIDCLENTGQLLEEYPYLKHARIDVTSSYTPTSHFNLALFERWSEFVDPGLQTEPPVRIIQHLSCTGGTLIAKCLAGLPNVALLSEVNPLSELHVESKPPGFAPTDLIYLASRGQFPFIDELTGNIFKADIKAIATHMKLLGKRLVIREHSHSDFLVGESPNGFSTTRKLLKGDHRLLSVLTVRHPVDSYLSLLNNRWAHFRPKTFDEYCRRYILFIEHNIEVPMYKYEDFIDDAPAAVKSMCATLDLPFNEDFDELFDIFALSGDSGRASKNISRRERRVFDDNFRKELNESANYQELCKKLDYVASLEA